MQNEIYTKKISTQEIEKSIEKVGFDKSYVAKVLSKYKFDLYKVHNLTCPQASIIKQLALSIGADAAVHREVITCKVEKSDIVIGATDAQIKMLAQKLSKQPFGLSKVAEQLIHQLSLTLQPIQIRNKKFDWGQKTYLMGIINVTPDSFSDGGDYFDLENALGHVGKLIVDGADIIDIGGESTRPNSQRVLPEEEQQRILPVIKKVREMGLDIPISVDTRNSSTAESAIEAGADIINDVSGFDWDNKMLFVAAQLGVPVVIMHSLGTPDTMQKHSQLESFYSKGVVDEIFFSLKKKVELAVNAGIKKENIIIDPGVGFGKTLEDNLQIIKHIEEFKSIGCPLLVGISRKSVIGNILNVTAEEREEANISLGSYLCANGADILRVHDVKKHYSAFKVLDAVIR